MLINSLNTLVQNNIFYELTNEPYGTPTESLFDYIKHEKEIVKKYDNNPIMISGNTYYDSSKLSEYYQKFKQQEINDVFVSHHYYNGEEIKYFQKFYMNFQHKKLQLSYHVGLMD